MRILTSLFKVKNPTRALTFAYVSAFSIIAVFTMAGHFTTYYIMQKQAESTDVTYHLSRIRGLIQRVPYHVGNFREHLTDVDNIILKQTLKEIDHSHLYLMNKIQAGNTISERLSEIYLGDRFDLHTRLARFIAEANVCANEDVQYGQPKKLCDIVVERLDAGLTTELSTGFDVALEGYRSETIRKIENYHMIQIYGTIVILAVLLLEAVLIFSPLIAKIGEYHKLLLRQALEDPLTKLRNRRAFTNSATSELAQSSRVGNTVSVVLMDLDKFKSVNDTYGHDVGDAVLKHFSRMLRRHLRKGDIIGRIGGEEFAVVLVRQTGSEQAFAVLDRMRSLVASTPCPYKDKHGKLAYLNYSVSIGVISLVPQNEKIDELLMKADEMLYKAKETGRNKVIIYDENGQILDKTVHEEDS